MAANEKTFGGAISEARKAKGWALKDLASRVLREGTRTREGWFHQSDPVDFLRTAARLVRPSTSPEASILCPASGVGTRRGI